MDGWRDIIVAWSFGNKNNRNGIAKYVGTKSKAQCILHFIGILCKNSWLLDNSDVPNIMSHDLDEDAKQQKNVLWMQNAMEFLEVSQIFQVLLINMHF